MKVLLKNDIGTFGKAAVEAIRQEMRLRAGAPVPQSEGAARIRLASESGTSVGLFQLAGSAGRVAVIKHVMHGFRSSRTNFDRADPFVFRERHRNYEIAID